MSNYLEEKYLGGNRYELFRNQLNGVSPELISGMSQSLLSNQQDKIIPALSKGINIVGGIASSSSLTDPEKNPVLGKIKEEGTKASQQFYKDNMSAADKVANSGFGKAMDKGAAAIGAANSVMKSVGSMFHGDRTGLQKTSEVSTAIRDAQYGVLKQIPITAPFAQAAELLDNTLGAITGGLGSATGVDKTLSAIPLVGNISAIFAGKTDSFKGDIQDINTGDFGGVVSDANRAKEISGVKSLQKNKLNKQIRAAQNDFNLTTSIVDFNKIRKNNNIGSDLLSKNLNKYQGNQQLTLAKKGTKLGLYQARRLLQESKKSNNNLPAGIALNIPGDGINKAVADVINIVDKAKNGLTENEVKDILFELTASATGNDLYKFKELVDNNKEYFINLFNKSGYGEYSEVIENNDYKNIYKIVKQIFNVQTFKSGGKLEKENIIPTGALHKNLHHIEENAPELEGKITKKGIPVGVYDENGEFQETCEIESGEIIFSIESTKQIEEYHSDGSDEAAIECGKFLVDQIFNNTRDDDKVIKKTE